MTDEDTDRMIRHITRSYGHSEEAFDTPLPAYGEWQNDEQKTLRDIWRASFTLADLDTVRDAVATWRSKHPRKQPTPADIHSAVRMMRT